jgi:2-alkenal reductase
VTGIIPAVNSWLYQLDESMASGSGIILSDSGYILTNNHVVDQMSNISVILADGTELPADVTSTDPYADLAILKVDGIMPAVAVFGSSDTLKPGETVIAIGSPLGSFKNSVTVGVVSATGRSLDTGNGYQMEDMIQTDASINPGNSGGPLVNLAGEVIGINTLILREGGGTTAEGLGFAVPSSLASTISIQIIENGFFARPNMGVRWQTITPAIARRYRLPVEYGAYVIEVLSGSPAEKAGIQANDIVTCIEDTCIDQNHLYYNTLFEHQPGQTVKITLLRGTETKNLDVTLGQNSTN